MWAALERVLEWSIPPSLHAQSSHFLRRAQFIGRFTLALCFWGPVFALVYAVFGSPGAAWAIVLATTCGLLTLPLLRRTGSLLLTGNWICLQLYWVLAAIALFTGGYRSPGAPWNLVVPVMAMVLAGVPSGLVWAGLAIAQYAVFHGVAYYGVAVPQDLSAPGLLIVDWLALTGLLILLATLTWLYESAMRQALRRIEQDAMELSLSRDQLAGEVEERTTAQQRLLQANDQLRQEVAERRRVEAALEQERNQLASVNNMITGREERMIQLKRRINELLNELQRPREFDV